MGFDYVNALHGLKPTELGSRKSLPAVISDSAGNPRALEVKAIEISFSDQMARNLCVTLTNNAIRNPGGFNVNTGPIIGIVEWGVGGAYNRIEFNLPPAYTWRQNGGIGSPVQGENGVTLSIACSSLRVMARNDARQPPVNDPTAVIGSDSFAGDYSAFVAQGSAYKPCGPLQRAIVAVSANGAALAAAGSVAIGIPRFAKRVRFPRRPLTSTLDVMVGGDIVGSAYTESIGAGTQGQIELNPLANTLTISNTSAGNITVLTAVFDLEI